MTGRALGRRRRNRLVIRLVGDAMRTSALSRAGAPASVSAHSCPYCGGPAGDLGDLHLTVPGNAARQAAAAPKALVADAAPAGHGRGAGPAWRDHVRRAVN